MHGDQSGLNRYHLDFRSSDIDDEMIHEVLDKIRETFKSIVKDLVFRFDHTNKNKSKLTLTSNEYIHAGVTPEGDTMINIGGTECNLGKMPECGGGGTYGGKIPAIDYQVTSD